MELVLNGFLHESHEAQTLNNGTELKRLIIKVPPRVNQFGEAIGETNYFEVTIFKKEKINEFMEGINAELAMKGLQKLKVACYVNGSERLFNDKKFYNVTLNVKSLQWIK